MPNTWNHGLFQCMDNCSMCLCAYFAPCWLFHKNAKQVDQKCGLCYWFIPGVNFYCCVKVRRDIEDEANIPKVGCCLDCVSHLFCHPCALVQEGQQLDEIPERKGGPGPRGGSAGPGGSRSSVGPAIIQQPE